MKVFIVYCYDRHIDPGISAHSTIEGANRKIEEFIAVYPEDYEWKERDYGRNCGWLRYVDCLDGDGPNARIQEMELQP